jgi:hypothetical protein
MALIAALMLVLILALVGMTSVQLAGQEFAGSSALQEERAAHHAAESAVDAVMGWFHDPSLTPDGVPPGWLSKRVVNAQGEPSYFDAQGHSQFKGTASQPDIVFDAADPQQDVMMNDPGRGWFRSLRGLAKILKLRVYGSMRPGLLCTVEVTAGAGKNARIKKTISVELGTFAIPALRAPLQATTVGSATSSTKGSVLVHWGDMMIRGAAYFSGVQEIPTKSVSAAVTGQAYDLMVHRDDRWIDLWIGDEGYFSQLPSGSVAGIPANVHLHQNPDPGVKTDDWQYERLKQLAKQFGRYYAVDHDGLLYANGHIESGAGVRPGEVLSSKAPGDHLGLIFVDTLDGSPPRADNLGTIVLEQEYVEGILVLNAHVRWKGGLAGKPVPALSPPPEGQTAIGTRIPVQLSGIHFQGVLFSAGNVTSSGRLQIHGGVMAQGAVSAEPGQEGSMEIWYNPELREGLLRGMPVVFIAPGSWQVKI